MDRLYTFVVCFSLLLSLSALSACVDIQKSTRTPVDAKSLGSKDTEDATLKSNRITLPLEDSSSKSGQKSLAENVNGLSTTDLQNPETAFSKIVASLPKNKTLAFTGVENLQGQNTSLSRKVFYRLESILLDVCLDQAIELVERKDLKVILDEWLLEMSGFTGIDKGAQELLGADIVLNGKVEVEGPLIHIYLKAMNIDDGLVLSAEEAWQDTGLYGGEHAALTASTQSLTATQPVNRNQSTSKDGQIKLWTEKTDYKIGDNLVIYFKITEASYVTLIDVTPDGEKTIIFPNPFMLNNYCKPGVTYRIPSPMAPFSLEITGPKGKDRIIAMTSNHPEIDVSVTNTRGIKFTNKIVNETQSRTNIKIDINSEE